MLSPLKIEMEEKEDARRREEAQAAMKARRENEALAHEVMDLQSQSVVHQREVIRWTQEHKRMQWKEAELEATAASATEARRKAEENVKSLDAEVDFLRGR